MTAASQTTKIFFEKKVSDISFSELRKRARKISLEAITEAAVTDCAKSFPAQTFDKIAEAGILEAVIPKIYGGAGLGIKAGTTFELLTLLKQLGYGNLVVGRIFEGHFNAWQLINEYAEPKQIEKLAIEARCRKTLFGVWNTEASDGVKIIPAKENKFRLEGAKTFASGAGFVNRPIVTGKLADGGWQMFVLSMDKVKIAFDDSWWQPLGMRSSRSYRVDFSGVEISAEDFIGEPDDYYKQPFFGGGAIRFAAVQLGAAELLFDLTREFLRELNRAGDAFQQMRLGEMAIAVESGNLWLRGASKIFDRFLREKNTENLERVLHYAGMTRTAIEQICQNIMLGCERSIGSRGLLKPYHFERVIRDLKMYLRQAAPDATLAGIGDFALKSDKQNGELWRGDDE
ncbi:MAG: acyl-CoA dehydrogenase family protein [Pyrinomonadaceae bacterium]